MRKLTYNIIENNGNSYVMEFITDREPEWTEEQFTRHRFNCKMELIKNEITEEKQSVSREVRLG